MQRGCRCDNLPSDPLQGHSHSPPLPSADSRDLVNDPRIRDLHGALEQRRPRILPAAVPVARAAVALILRTLPNTLDVLLIERPTSENDPWSGHMALPGGRRDGTEELLDTAIRETREEVGLELTDVGMLIGRLDDVRPRPAGPQIAVAPFVFAVPGTVDLAPDPAEVAQTVWIPLDHLTRPESSVEHLHVLPDGDELHFPALAYRGYVIWGITYRMLTQFLEIARTTDPGAAR